MSTQLVFQAAYHLSCVFQGLRRFDAQFEGQEGDHEGSAVTIYTILYAGIEYGIIACMETARKITVEIPRDLLDKAQRASGAGITQTVRTGLQLVAASRTYARLRQYRGKAHFSRTLTLLDRSLEERRVLMVPIVLTELLSDPELPSGVVDALSDVPMIEIAAGFWQRAGALRVKVLSQRRRARLGDALIAQACLDQGISLITRDRDFRTFADAAGLNIVSGP